MCKNKLNNTEKTVVFEINRRTEKMNPKRYHKMKGYHKMKVNHFKLRATQKILRKKVCGERMLEYSCERGRGKIMWLDPS